MIIASAPLSFSCPISLEIKSDLIKYYLQIHNSSTTALPLSKYSAVGVCDASLSVLKLLVISSQEVCTDLSNETNLKTIVV